MESAPYHAVSIERSARLVSGVHNVVGTGCQASVGVLVFAPKSYVNTASIQVRVCRQMAVMVDPALTLMMFLDGVVGLGGPLHAIFFDETSVCGWSKSGTDHVDIKETYSIVGRGPNSIANG